ncbi:MAG: hypothetical protein JKY17_08750 [Magnetovibrio sp.]|nr:hypothetical protein [Magnetovibrio sp.]
MSGMGAGGCGVSACVMAFGLGMASGLGMTFATSSMGARDVTGALGAGAMTAARTGGATFCIA